MPSKAHTQNGLRGTEAQAKTRLLLALWDLRGTERKVNKGELTKRIQRKGEKAENYQSIYSQLEKEGAIAIAKNKFSLSTPKGLEVLDEGLKSSNFRFETSVGAKTANALLKWLQQMDTQNGSVTIPTAQAKTSNQINSYKQFQQVALETYDRLNRDYNLDNLVPIYRIRREIGDRVSRTHFNEWLLEMQANDILQLIGGEMPDLTPDKAEDSIKTGLGGVRYYAKRL
jgi:hypothetical protein